MPITYLFSLILANFYWVACKDSKTAKIPLNEIERQQNEILKNLTREREMSQKLESKINEFNPKISDPSRLGIDLKSDIVSPQSTKTENQSTGSSKYNYTPPVIILLPEDTTERDTWEYKMAKSCLKGGFKAAYEGDNLTIVEMADDSEATIEELQEHIKKVDEQIKECVEKGDKLRSELNELKSKWQSDKNQEKILYVKKKISRLTKHLDSLDKRKDKLKNRLKAAILFKPKESETNEQGDKKNDDEEDD